MTSMQAPTGTTKSAKFQNVNPLGPMVDPFSDLDGEQHDYQKTLKESIHRRMMENSSTLGGRNPNTVMTPDDRDTSSNSKQVYSTEAYRNQLQHSLINNNERRMHPTQNSIALKQDDKNISTAEATNDSESHDSDDEWLDQLESDPALEALRAQRIEQMRQEQLLRLELKSKGHGEYRTISQDEFLPETCSAAATEAAAGPMSCSALSASSEWVVVHFFHDEFMKCKVMDHHLKIVAQEHLECKFLRIEAQKAPFFCNKLKILTLPTTLVLRGGNVVNRLVGFEGIAETDEWPTRLLQEWLCKSGAIHYKPSHGTAEVQNGSIRRGGVRHYGEEE